MIPPSKHSSADSGRLKHLQAGTTLIEILIAMFVLAIGVLALLAVQLRSVSSVREAEGQTIVSQITQNLIEGMLINPDLSAATDSSGTETGWTNKSYPLYITSAQQAASNANCYPADGTTLDKSALATAQICAFGNELATALPETQVHFAICQDDSAATPTFEDGSFDAQCSGAGPTVVKVLWLADIEENAASALTTYDNTVVYTYQARVAGE